MTIEIKKIEGQAVKSRCKAKRRSPCRSHWFRDRRSEGNLCLLDASLGFLQNFCTGYNGPVKDSALFSPVARVMSIEKLDDIFHACTNDPVRKELKRQEFGSIDGPDLASTENLLKALWLHPDSNSHFRRELGVWLGTAREVLSVWMAENPDPTAARLEEWGKLMSLTDPQSRLMTLKAAIAMRVMPCNDLIGKITSEKIRIMAALLDVSDSEYLGLVAPNSKLRRFGCLDGEEDLDDSLLQYLHGARTDSLSRQYFIRCQEQPLSWECFGRLAETHGKMLKRMVAPGRGRGQNILLYGQPDTGKTSFAVALAFELGRTAYLISQGDGKVSSCRHAFRFAALQVCDGQVDPDKSLIIIDEADEMLENELSEISLLFSGGDPLKSGKGLVNDAMNNIKAPCLWIVNSKACDLHASNRCRFDYSIRFEKPTLSQREAIWRNVAERCKVKLGNNILADLAARYEVSFCGISQAVANLAAIGISASGEAVETLEQLLDQYSELMGITSNRERVDTPDGYSLEGLNVNGRISPARLLEVVGSYLREKDDSARSKIESRHISILLAGPPGTGKTEFVRHMGRVLERRILTKLGGDLLDKYVGGTEERIRATFAEAETEQAILFLDEIDGMLQSRERALRSWEVTQVNELLHMMDQFRGVFVGATNFIKSLDRAVLRRFTFKLEFGYLTDEGKRSLFQHVFNSFGDVRMSSQQEARLLRIPDLSAGDFWTVRRSLIYADDDITVPALLEGLEQESEAKRQGAAAKIGYG